MMTNSFKALDTRNYQMYRIYAIRNDSVGFPHFLIYENNQWKWQSAKYYKPTAGDDVNE